MYQGHIVPDDGSRGLPGDTLVSGAADEPPLRQFVETAIGLIRRQYLVMLLSLLVGLGASVAYLRVTPPTYKATAKVLLENPRIQFLQQQSLLAPTQMDRTQLENQLEILKSKPIAVAVIAELGLANDPDFNSADRTWRMVTRAVNDAFSRVFDLAIANVPSVPSAPKPRADDPSDDLVTAFQDRLKGERVGQSNVIEISYSASSPERAAKIANAVANAYLAEQTNARFEASRTGTTWLQARLEELGQQALTSERAVNEFKARNNMVAVGGNSVEDQQIADLNTRLVAVREQAADAMARMNRYEAIVRSQGSDAKGADVDAAMSDTVTNPIISSLRQQYLEIARREAEWSARLGHNHLAVVNLRGKMNELRASIAAEVRRLAESSRNDYEIARQRESALIKQIAETVSKSRAANSAEAKLRELEMTAKNYRNLYDSFLQQYVRSVQQQSLPVSDARVISPASPPHGKSKPKSALIVALGLFFGAALGGGLGLLRDAMDRAFRTTAQVKSALHTTCLALVPLVNDQTRRRPALLRLPPAEEAARRVIVRNQHTLWTAAGMPLSPFAESIRFIKLAINLSSASVPNRIIGITSALAHEGKSTIAAAVGDYITRSGGRVILVDCDLRNPSLSALLAPRANVGIVEVLAGNCALEEAIWKDTKTDLDFLPAVTGAELANTSEILSAESTRRLFKRLRAAYDYVIVDLPPLTPIVDVRATTPWIDGYILTIEWGRTNIDIVQHALRTAPDVRQALIGAVLNKVDLDSIGRYDAREGRYYRYKDYTRSAA